MVDCGREADAKREAKKVNRSGHSHFVGEMRNVRPGRRGK
jgi:hypothetical protein